MAGCGLGGPGPLICGVGLGGPDFLEDGDGSGGAGLIVGGVGSGSSGPFLVCNAVEGASRLGVSKGSEEACPPLDGANLRENALPFSLVGLGKRLFRRSVPRRKSLSCSAEYTGTGLSAGMFAEILLYLVNSYSCNKTNKVTLPKNS